MTQMIMMLIKRMIHQNLLILVHLIGPLTELSMEIAFYFAKSAILKSLARWNIARIAKYALMALIITVFSSANVQPRIIFATFGLLLECSSEISSFLQFALSFSLHKIEKPHGTQNKFNFLKQILTQTQQLKQSRI